jgi:hypothetical protein
MQLDEKQRDGLDKELQAFVDKYGEGILTDIYRLHRKLIGITGDFKFPVKEAYLYDLSLRIEKYQEQGLTYARMAEEENVSVSFIYTYFHRYYLPKKKNQSVKRREISEIAR